MVETRKYTRRDMVRIASLGAAAVASDSEAMIRSMLGLHLAMPAQGGNMTDKQLAEDLERLMTNTLVTVDWPFAINIDYGYANGVRPFSGQTNLRVVKLPNLTLRPKSGYGVNFLDGANNLEEIWVDSLQTIPNSFASSTIISYVYAPSFEWGKNFFNGARATGAVFDMGQSRTCAVFISSMATSFENLSNVWKGWTFRCSDGDVAWNGSEWAKVAEA